MKKPYALAADRGLEFRDQLGRGLGEVDARKPPGVVGDVSVRVVGIIEDTAVPVAVAALLVDLDQLACAQRERVLDREIERLLFCSFSVVGGPADVDVTATGSPHRGVTPAKPRGGDGGTNTTVQDPKHGAIQINADR